MSEPVSYAEPNASSWADVIDDAGTLPWDLHALATKYPALTEDRRLMLTMALKEYELRMARGEEVPIMEFTARFPACRSILAKQLLAWECTAAVWAGEDLPDKSFATAGVTGVPQWPLAGDRVGGFTIVAELGRGAFARVYLALESALGDRPVALKLSVEGKDLPDAALEAQILGRLRHDNVVPIHSVQHDLLSGCTVVCMPYLGHTTLMDLLDYVYTPPFKVRHRGVVVEVARKKTLHEDAFVCEKPSPILQEGTYIDSVIELGVQLASALAFVHERNILHRDLKPSNVLLRPDGRPMLLDFNLSLLNNEGGREQVDGGTLLYMSPEHLRATLRVPDSRPSLIDPRSDLYSLGVILYELLAGNHPFLPWHSPEHGLGENKIREILGTRQPGGAPSLSRANPLIDKRLSRTVAKCLAYEPSERFASAADLAESLRECLMPVQRARRWAIGQPRSFWPGIAAAFLGVVLAAVLVVRLSSVPPFERGIEALQAGQYAPAVAYFSQALDEQDSPRTRMARGRAYQRLGDFDRAIKDYTRADELRPSGHKKACMAYCYSLLDPPQHRPAQGLYRAAEKRGCRTVAILNNFGFSVISNNKAATQEAKQWFQKAVDVDPGFQLGYYNIMKTELDAVSAGYRKARITRQGLAALEKVFATGTVNGNAHKYAARFLVLARDIEPRWKEQALEHARQAVNLGVRPRLLQTDNDLIPLRESPMFPGIPGPFVSPGAVPDIPRSQDPFLSIDE